MFDVGIGIELDEGYIKFELLFVLEEFIFMGDKGFMSKWLKLDKVLLFIWRGNLLLIGNWFIFL